jgi:2-amino-4-hydroxy-6-hydroxymethyldihydropteridine diphosphokinase
MTIAYLALGSNLGDRLQNLREAARRLAARMSIVRVSDVFETKPWGVTDQPKFLNCALEAETELELLALLEFVKRVEREMGRAESVRYGPRLIDIDILMYGERILKNDVLEIPHPRMRERRFVLAPLAQIAPELRVPTSGETVSALLRKLPDNGDVEFYADWDDIAD